MIPFGFLELLFTCLNIDLVIKFCEMKFHVLINGKDECTNKSKYGMKRINEEGWMRWKKLVKWRSSYCWWNSLKKKQFCDGKIAPFNDYSSEWLFHWMTIPVKNYSIEWLFQWMIIPLND